MKSIFRRVYSAQQRNFIYDSFTVDSAHKDHFRVFVVKSDTQNCSITEHGLANQNSYLVSLDNVELHFLETASFIEVNGSRNFADDICGSADPLHPLWVIVTVVGQDIVGN